MKYGYIFEMTLDGAHVKYHFTLLCQKYWQSEMKECTASNTNHQWEEPLIEVGRWRDSLYQRALFSVRIKSCQCPSPFVSLTALTLKVAVCNSIQLNLISTGLVAKLWLVYSGLQRGTEGLNLPCSTSENRRDVLMRAWESVCACARVCFDGQPP